MDKIDSVISETAQSITRLPRPRLHYGLLVQHQQPFHWPDQLRPRYRYIHIDVQCDIDLLSHSPSLTGGMRTFSRLRWLEPSHLQWAPITAGDLRYPWGHHVCPIWKLGVRKGLWQWQQHHSTIDILHHCQQPKACSPIHATVSERVAWQNHHSVFFVC